MPAAYYEFNFEENANFVAGFKILNSSTGNLFKFIPNSDQDFYSGGSYNFDIPDEIKLLYPNVDDAFGWLKNSTSGSTGIGEFLRLSMKVKTGVNANDPIKACGCARWGRFASAPSGYTSIGVNTYYESNCSGGTNSCGTGSSISFKLMQLNNNVLPTTPGTGGTLPPPGSVVQTSNNNLIMSSLPSGTIRGKYVYDMELIYQLGNASSVNNGRTEYIIRLMQGTANYTPNVTK